ncbi:MAG: DUF4280 domain-containing protein [Moheibacter sp.]
MQKKQYIYDTKDLNRFIMSEKHLVCQGATLQCQFGTAPDKLKVLTQTRQFINDKEGKDKLMATHADIGTTLEKNTFGSCAKMNNNPCVPAITKWEGYYQKITIQENGGKALLEDSKATCAVAGTACIQITDHGQVSELTKQNADNADPDALASICSFMKGKGRYKREAHIPKNPKTH